MMTSSLAVEVDWTVKLAQVDLLLGIPFISYVFRGAHRIHAGFPGHVQHDVCVCVFFSSGLK